MNKKESAEAYKAWRSSMSVEIKQEINKWLKEHNQPAQFVSVATFSKFARVSAQSVRNWAKDPEHPLFKVEPKAFTNGTYEGEFIDIYWFRAFESELAESIKSTGDPDRTSFTPPDKIKFIDPEEEVMNS